MKTIVLLILALLLAGCVSTSPVQRYDDEMTRVASLYKQGLVSEAQKKKVVEYGESFWLSYHQSLDDLEKFLGYTTTLPMGVQ